MLEDKDDTLKVFRDVAEHFGIVLLTVTCRVGPHEIILEPGMWHPELKVCARHFVEMFEVDDVKYTRRF